MWFDMDILFVKPFPEVLFESEEDLSLCFYQNTIPTGLILSKPNLSVLKFLLDNALNILSTKRTQPNYQMIGPDLWRQAFPKLIDVVLLNSDFFTLLL